MTQTSFCSAASRSAIPKPTCPAPQMITFIDRPASSIPLPNRGEIDVKLEDESKPRRQLYSRRFQFPMQGRALHADKLRRARDIAAKTVDLSQKIFLLEHLARFAQRQRHDVLIRLRGHFRH